MFPSDFPGFASNTIQGYLVAPYWSNNDISGDEGEVFYEVHVAGGTKNSAQYLANVSDFISCKEHVTFQVSCHIYSPLEHVYYVAVPGRK